MFKAASLPRPPVIGYLYPLQAIGRQTMLTRRMFNAISLGQITMVISSGAATGYGAQNCAARGWTSSFPDEHLMLLPDFNAAARIGNRIRASLAPTEVERLIGNAGARLAAMEKNSSSWFEAALADDFRNHRTTRVDGFRFSDLEAGLFLRAAELAASRESPPWQTIS
jgi:hypothetical protein